MSPKSRRASNVSNVIMSDRNIPSSRMAGEVTIEPMRDGHNGVLRRSPTKFLVIMRPHVTGVQP